MITCRICKKGFEYINSFHLKTHGITTEEYRAQFPGTEIVSAEKKEKTRLSVLRNYEEFPGTKKKIGLANSLRMTEYFRKFPERVPFLKAEVKEKISRCWTGCKRNGKVCPHCGKIHKDTTGKNNPSSDPEVLEKIKIFWNKPENKLMKSLFMKDFLKKFPEKHPNHNPFVQQKKPNKPEKIIMSYIEELKLPYKYTGNFSFWIDWKNPDFVNVNNEKKLIELLGNYWHGKSITGRNRRQEENYYIKHYKKFGWKTLIIWENELKEPEKVKQKLRIFDNL